MDQWVVWEEWEVVQEVLVVQAVVQEARVAQVEDRVDLVAQEVMDSWADSECGTMEEVLRGSVLILFKIWQGFF